VTLRTNESRMLKLTLPRGFSLKSAFRPMPRSLWSVMVESDEMYWFQVSSPSTLKMSRGPSPPGASASMRPRSMVPYDPPALMRASPALTGPLGPSPESWKKTLL
jgi:hypothetical protein